MSILKDHHYWMGKAIGEARKAERLGEVPIGAVIVREGGIIGRGHNLRESRHDPVAHAELLAVRQAARRSGNWRLTGAILYVTLEPCVMCMGAPILARIDTVVFGCRDPKAGAAGSLYDLSCDPRLNHRFPLIEGVRGEECSAMLSQFFSALREEKRGKKV